MPDRVIEFLKEFHDILEDYRVDIGVCWCEGVDDPNLCFNVGDEEIHNRFDSSQINRVDIKELIEKLKEERDA